MDIDDNDAQDQNLHIVGEETATVSPVSDSYSLPRFEFDDSLRFDNIVDNEGFLEITSQEDNQWIEEYSTAVKSTRKNVWSEATSSESVEMLLKSVGQEEKVIEEGSLTNIMDPKGTLESVVLGDKNNSSVGEETPKRTGSFVNVSQEDSSVSKVECENAAPSQNVVTASGMSTLNKTGSFVNVSQEDPSVFKVECENAAPSQNVDTASGLSTLNKIGFFVNASQEDSSVSKVECENAAPSQNVDTASGMCMSKDSCDKDLNCISKSKENSMDKSTNSDSIAEICTHSAEKITVVLNVEPADSSKIVEGVFAVAHAESNMDVLTDAVVAVESSKGPFSDTTDGVQLPSGTVVTSDVATEDQPRSPILGVSLSSDNNREKLEVGSTNEGSFPEEAPEVEKGTASGGAEKVVNSNVGQSEQTGDDEAGILLDPKKSMTGEDGVESVNLADQQPASGDVDGSSGCVTNPSCLDKPQFCSSSDTKSIENATFSSSNTKEEKNFTFETNASASQNPKFSTNMVPPVSSSVSQLDPIKLHEDSPVSQSPTSTIVATGVKGNPASKPRKRLVTTETTNQNNNLKEKTKTPTRRSRKTEKSPTIPVSNSKSGDMTPISAPTLPILNNSTFIFHNSFTDNQQVQLRAQILVYGSILSGVPPEEPHMIAAFGECDGGRKAWEGTWHAYVERVRGHKAQPNNPGPGTPSQATKVGSGQSKTLSGISSPVVNPMIPISSPIWNISTPGGGPQSNAMPKSDLFGPYQTPGVQNFAGHTPMWLSHGPLSHGPFPGQWVAPSPVASFNARISALPITESVKLTTIKESGAPSIPGIPVGPTDRPSVSQMVSSGQTSVDTKSRKRKKDLSSQVTTTVALSTPGNFVSAISTPSILGQPSNLTHVNQNMEKIVTRENSVSKIEEAKAEAADAAVHAAAAVNHCQNVWSQLESQKSSCLVSDDEAKLASSAVSIAAASSVAKLAAYAAKIASDVAEQARLMADEVFLSNRSENHDQSSTTSIISVAKEAARRRLEAASAASKHAENLDAIVKAAELAAEAVSQAGKIVAIGNPLSLKKLAEAGPEGYWKSPQHASQQGHSEKLNVEAALNYKEDSVELVKNQNIASYEKDKSTEMGRGGPNLPQTAGVISKPESESVHNFDVDPKDNIIREGCLVEVRKDDDKKKNAWFAANVLTLKDGKAFVCYTELQSDDGSGKLKEWVPLEVEGTGPPRIRIAHPVTTMRSEGTRKRGRKTLTDHAWCFGDRVDVWVQDCWCEAVVVETNNTDSTFLTVQFPAKGETSVVGSWHVRPTLNWKDGRWIEWSSLKGSHTSELQGDTPRGKRHKIGGSPAVEGKDKAKLSDTANIVESGIHQESRIIPISSQGLTIDLGRSVRNENKFDTLRTVGSGLQKKQSRVVFGVPKPGKTQKFMDVSTNRVDERNNNNNNTRNDPVKLTNYLMPQASGARGPKSNPKNDAKEKKAAEVKPRVTKYRKPPVPSVRTLTHNDKSKPSKPTSRDAFTSDENMSGQPNKMDLDSFSIEDAKESSTSKDTKVGETASGATADRKATKVEGQDKSTSEIEPRRSVRRIQPTSRLLEGLQSSLTVSHVSQRSHKVTSKGSSN